MIVNYSQCPICKSDHINLSNACIDHTVSKKTFSIWFCNVCTLKFTQDAPSQNEIGKYYASDNYISHSDTNKGFINRIYHLVRKKTLVSKGRLVGQHTKMQSGNILDIGCGTGAFLNEMKTNGWTITGLEPDVVARNKAKELYNIEPLQADEIYTLPHNKYDAITLWHVLEHVHDLHGYIAQFEKLLKPSGKLFIAVPNYTSYDATKYVDDWAAYDVPRHLYHFSPNSMQVLLQQHGLTLTVIKPMWFDSFYVSMLSEKNKNKKGNFISAFLNGLLSNIKAMGKNDKCSSVIYVIKK
jgi:2-polyprenyl-3-methyl-5-hydroxy-6-metoxy-1,4-benzoquinol methylase